MLRQRGFTLVELMISITLFGLLVALGLPAFTGWVKNSQVRTVAEALQTGLRVAQTEALRRNTAVVFFRTNTDLTTANVASPGNIGFASGGTNWAVLTVPQFGAAAADFVQGGALGGAAAATTLTGPDALCFDANGHITAFPATSLPSGATCTATAATFTASQPAPADRQLNVLVSVGGKVRMCDPTRTFSATAPDGC